MLQQPAKASSLSPGQQPLRTPASVQGGQGEPLRQRLSAFCSGGSCGSGWLLPLLRHPAEPGAPLPAPAECRRVRSPPEGGFGVVLGLSLPTVVHPWVLPLASEGSRCEPLWDRAASLPSRRGGAGNRVGLKFRRGHGQLLVVCHAVPCRAVPWRDVMWHEVGARCRWCWHAAQKCLSPAPHPWVLWPGHVCQVPCVWSLSQVWFFPGADPTISCIGAHLPAGEHFSRAGKG